MKSLRNGDTYVSKRLALFLHYFVKQEYITDDQACAVKNLTNVLVDLSIGHEISEVQVKELLLQVIGGMRDRHFQPLIKALFESAKMAHYRLPARMGQARHSEIVPQVLTA
ncbi:MAG: hypothetical protein KBC48_02045 [Candidatus Pacebacteria bacterium]|nr:hypothetical protein [Candidatus Paceibacterota bacterium]